MGVCTNGECGNNYEANPPVSVVVLANKPLAERADWGHYCSYTCALADMGQQLLEHIGAEPENPAEEVPEFATGDLHTQPDPVIKEVDPVLEALLNEGDAEWAPTTPPTDQEMVTMTQDDAPGPLAFEGQDMGLEEGGWPDAPTPTNGTGNNPAEFIPQKIKDELKTVLADVWDKVEGQVNVETVIQKTKVAAPPPGMTAVPNPLEVILVTSTVCDQLSEALAYDYGLQINTKNEPIQVGEGVSARFIFTLIKPGMMAPVIVSHDVENLQIVTTGFSAEFPADKFIPDGQYPLLKEALETAVAGLK